MLRATVKIQGDQETIDRLRRLDNGLLNFSSAMTQIGSEAKKYFSGQVFASQGGVLGVKWPTLAAKTVLYKLKRYPQYASTPLIRTGTMKRSFYAKSTATSVTIGNTAPYFPYHQLGTGIGGGRSGTTFKLGSLARAYSIGSQGRGRHLPARRMLAINDDLMDIVKRVLQADIARKVKGA